MLSRFSRFFRTFSGMNRNLQIYCLASVISGFGSGLLGGGLFLIFLRHLGIEMVELGALGSLYAVFRIFLMPVAGGSADRYGRRKLILLNSFGGLVTPAVAFVALHWTWLLPALILGNLLGIISSPAYRAFMADATEAESRQTAMVTFSTITAVPGLVSPALGGLLAGYWGIRALFILQLVFNFAGALILFGFLRETAPVTMVEKREAMGWRERIRGYFSFIREGIHLIPKAGGRNLIAIIVMLCLTDIQSPAFQYLAIYVYETLHTPYWVLGVIYPVGTACAMLTKVPIGKLSDKYGQKPFIVFGSIISALAIFFMVYIPNYYWLIPLFAISQIGGTMYGPSITALMYDITPSQVRGTLFGIIDGPIRGGTQMMAPILDGYIWTRFGGLTIIYMLSGMYCMRGMIGVSLTQEKGVKKFSVT